jgi:release factor glutamine methyltransferase
MIAARVARVPVSRITGRRTFWGRDFAVTADVLDPRPETEVLVALALAGPFDRVLDLGTGSGCILVTLLAERPAATGTGTDVSDGALVAAQANAVALGVADRATFVPADWFAGAYGRFALIVSNPPYIAEDEMPGLAAEVRDHDPRIALTPGGDGLAAHRAIAADACRHLMPGGRLLIEIGPTQGRAVADLMSAGGLTDIRVLPDLDGRDRVISACNGAANDS